MTDNPDADLVEMLRVIVPAWHALDIQNFLVDNAYLPMRGNDFRRILTWANARRDAAVAAARERIIREIEDEVDNSPCSEDAAVIRDVATLIRADFCYEQAEALEIAEESKDAHIDRLRAALEPFARADRAIGNEPGPFRFETSTGHRVIEREDLRRAAAALSTPDHLQKTPAATPPPPPAWLPHATFAAMSAEIARAVTGTGTSIADWQANAGLIAALGVLPDVVVIVERMLKAFYGLPGARPADGGAGMRAALGVAFGEGGER